MLHPAMVLAVAVLAVNDHWLKDRFGGEPGLGLVTGKLSDVAGLAFFPALLASVVEVARWALGRDGRDGPEGGWADRRRVLAAATAVTVAGFVAVKSLPAAGTAYEVALAAVRWLPAAVASVPGGGPPPRFGDVGHVVDASDILCLPAVWASHRAARRTGWPAGAPAGPAREGRAVGT